MEEKKVNTLTALRLRLGLKLAPGKMSHVKQFSEAPPDTEIIFADWFTQANNSA